MQEANREIDSVGKFGKRGMEVKAEDEKSVSSPIPPAGPDDFRIRRSGQGLEGGVNSALSCKQGHAHYIATLSLGGWWN
jgi:hypothetical protein